MSPITEVRCSGLSRVMHCQGFVFMKDLPPDKGNDAAAEGTACGELLTAMLLQKTTTPQVKPQAANGVRFDNDMYFYAGLTTEYVLSQTMNEITFESRIDWMTQSGIKIRGQYDISYVKGSNLHVEDLKYGWGIVEVEDNWQLLGYALGKVLHLGQTFEKIILTIHQPRPHHEDGPIRSWEITYGHLMEYREKIEKQMYAISQGHSELQTGPHCRYCQAAGSCAAISRGAYIGVDLAMGSAVQDHLSDSDLAKEFDILDRASDLLRTRKDSIQQLIINRIQGGAVVPNYGVKETFGHRKWKKAVTPDSIKMLTGKDAMEKVMLSPAKVEKLGKGKAFKSFIDGMTEKYRTGIKVERKDLSAEADRVFGNN